jgi:hypothetical protein
MGLDITAYRNLAPVANPEFDEYNELKNWETEWLPGTSMDWSESVWEGRGEGVNAHTVYTWEDCFDFRAGSYSGYGWWRDKLEEISDGESFQELINFADNEGVIGSVVSQKLYTDFIKNYDKAEEHSKKINDGEYWLNKYDCWMKAFDMARYNGAVDFH